MAPRQWTDDEVEWLWYRREAFYYTIVHAQTKYAMDLWYDETRDEFLERFPTASGTARSIRNVSLNVSIEQDH